MGKKTIQTEAVINLQANLGVIRSVLKLRLYDVGEYLGLTYAAIHAMEKGRRKMSIAQYIALRHMFDHEADKIDDPIKQRQFKLIISSLIDESDDPDFDWTEEIIRQVQEATYQ